MSDTRNGDGTLAALSAPVDSEMLAMLHRRLEAAAQAEGALAIGDIRPQALRRSVSLLWRGDD